MVAKRNPPNGLYYLPDFLAPQQGSELFETLLASREWTPVNPDNANSREVIQYGWTYPYKGGRFVKGAPIPPELDFANLPHFTAQADQLIVNKYRPREGIAAHVDHPEAFGPAIVCITLGSGCEVEFTRVGEEAYRLYVEPGSAYVLTGEARYLWRHGIRQRLADPVAGARLPRATRISLTYRTMAMARK